MAKRAFPKRRDSKHRVLRVGESVREDGLYQFKYHVNGKAKFIYSWRLEPTDKLPQGKKPCLSLREMEKKIGYDLDSQMDPSMKNMTVMELVKRYLATRTGAKPSTLTNYRFVLNLLGKEDFSGKRIGDVKTSDAKLFLIKMQADGKGYSSVKTVRGVLRPAFQMAVDDDYLQKNPFGFQLAGVVINDSVTREAITKDQMRKFLKFVHDDNNYCRYYEAFYILFHTGMRISEFCGLTIHDLDMEKRIIDINKQLQRTSQMEYMIESTKTNAGTRKLPMTEEVFRCFQAILEDRESPRVEKMVGGYTGFLYLDKNGMPEVAMHWEHRFNHAVSRYNEIYREQLPNITPHVCRHTYCSNQAKAGMNPKTLQYLMGHSDIGVTMNVYTHLGMEDAAAEMARMEEVESARREQEKLNGVKEGKEKQSRKMFRVV
ncbi:MAG: site-specific integrase [Lachnospiraceae bacterium]|nr:site-specific integrase [Lachnospiraceae bacterium]